MIVPGNAGFSGLAFNTDVKSNNGSPCVYTLTRRRRRMAPNRNPTGVLWANVPDPSGPAFSAVQSDQAPIAEGKPGVYASNQVREGSGKTKARRGTPLISKRGKHLCV
jgi:hypothetical protein